MCVKVEMYDFNQYWLEEDMPKFVAQRQARYGAMFQELRASGYNGQLKPYEQLPVEKQYN